MAKFNFHLAGGSPRCWIETGAETIGELGEELMRRRFVTGLLIQEDDQALEPPIDVLIPLQRVLLVAAAA